MDMSWSRMSWAMSYGIDRTRGLTMACSATLMIYDRVPTISGEEPSTQASKTLDVDGTRLVAPSRGPRLTLCLQIPTTVGFSHSVSWLSAVKNLNVEGSLV